MRKNIRKVHDGLNAKCDEGCGSEGMEMEGDGCGMDESIGDCID